MKSLKLTAEEAKEQEGCCVSPSGGEEGPAYPWGTSLCLGDEALEKLGIGLIPMGTEVLIMAKARVTGTSSRERANGKTQDMDIQITAMELTPVQADRMAAKANRLFPNADKD